MYYINVKMKEYRCCVDERDRAVTQLRHHHIADAQVRQQRVDAGLAFVSISLQRHILYMFRFNPRCIRYMYRNTFAVSTRATVPSLSCATITSRTRGCGSSESTPASPSSVSRSSASARPTLAHETTLRSERTSHRSTEPSEVPAQMQCWPE